MIINNKQIRTILVEVEMDNEIGKYYRGAAVTFQLDKDIWIKVFHNKFDLGRDEDTVVKLRLSKEELASDIEWKIIHQLSRGEFVTTDSIEGCIQEVVVETTEGTH